MNAVEILAPNDQSVPGVAQSVKARTLTIHDSLQIKAADYWQRLDEPDQALRELVALPSKTWKHGWGFKTQIAAIGGEGETT